MLEIIELSEDGDSGIEMEEVGEEDEDDFPPFVSDNIDEIVSPFASDNIDEIVENDVSGMGQDDEFSEDEFPDDS